MQRPLILFLGDSLTDGYTLGKEVSYPSIIGKKIAERKIPLGIFNAGVSGDTTADALRRLPKYIDLPISIFVVALGTNDYFQEVPPIQMESSLREIFATVRRRHPNAKLVLVGIKAFIKHGNSNAPEFEAVFPRVALEFGAKFIPCLLEGIAGVSSLNLEDDIHPNIAGQAKMADLIFNQLEPLLLEFVEDAN